MLNVRYPGEQHSGVHTYHQPTGHHYIKVALVLTLVTALASVPLQAQQPKPRIEKHLLGEKEIPGDAYYGVQTARAKENFQISGISINHYPGFIEAWAIVKLAAARANTDVGAMKKDRLDAIGKATQACATVSTTINFKSIGTRVARAIRATIAKSAASVTTGFVFISRQASALQTPNSNLTLPLEEFLSSNL